MKDFLKIAVLAAVVLVLAVLTFLKPHVTGLADFPNFKQESIAGDAELLNIQQAIAFFEHAIRRQPDNSDNYVQLAKAYLQQSRISGGHHDYLPSARKMLDKALQLEPDNFEAIATQAAVHMSYHRFEQALTCAKKALAMNDRSAFLWGIYSDALKELGEYEAAVAACDRMLALRPDIRSYSRASHLREIHGDLAGAIAAMKMAVNAGVIGTEAHAWAAYQLGNLYLKDASPDTAALIFNGILETKPAYAYALEGLARVHQLRGNEEAAIQNLLQAYGATRDHAFKMGLVPLYEAIGKPFRATAHLKSVLDAFEHHQDDGWIIDLELADFLLEHELRPVEALERAEAEYNRRPGNVDVLCTYGWALYESGRFAEAEAVSRKLLMINPVHRRGLLLAGLLNFLKGEKTAAAAQLYEGLSAGVNGRLSEKAQKTLQALGV